jgi:hypothetical protein
VNSESWRDSYDAWKTTEPSMEPTDADVEDAAEREQDALAEAEAVLARDTAFCAWLRDRRRYHQTWTILLHRLAHAIPILDYREWASDDERHLIDLARAESWPYVMRLIADVMEREAFDR